MLIPMWCLKHKFHRRFASRAVQYSGQLIEEHLFGLSQFTRVAAAQANAAQSDAVEQSAQPSAAAQLRYRMYVQQTYPIVLDSDGRPGQGVTVEVDNHSLTQPRQAMMNSQEGSHRRAHGTEQPPARSLGRLGQLGYLRCTKVGRQRHRHTSSPAELTPKMLTDQS